MTIVETSIQVNKPVERVFEFLTNLDDMKKMSQYITGIEADGPLKLGSKYTIKTSSNGYNIETKNEVVAFEKNKIFGSKAFAAPPASDVISTYILEKDGAGTKLILQTDAVLVPAGMPSMPGMEDMMKTQMISGFNTMLASMKKAIEG